jgi:hypothetical protein
LLKALVSDRNPISFLVLGEITSQQVVFHASFLRHFCMKKFSQASLLTKKSRRRAGDLGRVQGRKISNKNQATISNA